jgi:hypothetical protein
MPLQNFGTVAQGFTRSAQPRDAGDYAQLALIGVTRIYKLDKDSEYSYALEAKYFPSGRVVDSTVSQLFPPADQVRSIASSINSNLTSGLRVHAHCVHGTDRTGLICAAYQILYQGMSVSAALEQRSEFGTTWYGDLLWDHNIVSLLHSLG